ncbi:hypothetical protein KSC_082600 [Ktedonobacter sp. SOSP1-52]|uniref:macro domain-containing protein n=1 Tax=Ktedonobacter sp. SOSP1-52 TaxID=2778366 RepID=UPI001915B992|nr:macro domain-containing protein [Ktedonobacter sp. SOSP1-52]GHO69368.1 hypothetical protein KSC_082600 [Ktedonobacter sp. SOSP1-52]
MTTINGTATNVTILPGDITVVPADALITLINSGGIWGGGVDRAIMQKAGQQFHQIAAQHMPNPIRQGDVIFADGSRIQHSGAFRNVIFVIDDLQLSLEDLVKEALEVAFVRGLQNVSLPLMRTGLMAGMVEKTPEEVAYQMSEAIKEVAATHPSQTMEIKIVIYVDPQQWSQRLLATLQAR